jgi:hypothetical protein
MIKVGKAVSSSPTSAVPVSSSTPTYQEGIEYG